jgi:hypothetical protein
MSKEFVKNPQASLSDARNVSMMVRAENEKARQVAPGFFIIAKCYIS